MSIRNKILLAFSASAILLTGISFIIAYWLFSAYREEAFQQQQREKIQATLKLIEHVKQQSEAISNIMDAQDIHDFYDEKLLIYDGHKALIFSSLDDLDIERRKEVLYELSPVRRWIETKEGQYDLVGVYLERNGKSYYAISKAYDALGYDKLNFLQRILLIIFIVLVATVLLIAFYLANHLSRPLNQLAYLLSRYDLNEAGNVPLKVETGTKELDYLSDRFNELLARTRDAFTFQKNTVNHISHQLKTPVAILVSEMEKLQSYNLDLRVKEMLNAQIQRAKALGDTISTLLEIAQIEARTPDQHAVLRLDEIIFDLLEQVQHLHPGFQLHLRFLPEAFTERQMEVKGNELLLKHALENLLSNCVLYSGKPEAQIIIDTRARGEVAVRISNDGKLLSEADQKRLFHYFFRGENSQGKPGSGLGLVLVQKIVEYHQGRIGYTRSASRNTFVITLPTAFQI